MSKVHLYLREREISLVREERMWIVRFSSCETWTVSCVLPVDSLIEMIQGLNSVVCPSRQINVLSQPDVLGSNKWHLLDLLSALRRNIWPLLYQRLCAGACSDPPTARGAGTSLMLASCGWDPCPENRNRWVMFCQGGVGVEPGMQWC